MSNLADLPITLNHPPLPMWMSADRYRRNVAGEVEKRCACCRRWGVVGARYFHRCGNSADGVQSWCRRCFQARHAARVVYLAISRRAFEAWCVFRVVG